MAVVIPALIEKVGKMGAIGVMQVMPATGKAMKVGDITETEANIHAGIKYMRWMIDHYYGNEPMTELDKALFAFASYNAGAGRFRNCARKPPSADSTTTSGSRTWNILRPIRSVRKRSPTSGTSTSTTLATPWFWRA